MLGKQRYKRKVYKRVNRLYKWIYNYSVKLDSNSLHQDDQFAFIEFQSKFKEISDELFSKWAANKATHN